RLVKLAVPDARVVAAAPPRPHAQDDQVEHQPPLHPVLFDDAAVGQELGEVAAHRPIVGRVGRAEVVEEDADAPGVGPAGGGRGQAGWTGGGGGGGRGGAWFMRPCWGGAEFLDGAPPLETNRAAKRRPARMTRTATASARTVVHEHGVMDLGYAQVRERHR